MQRLSLPAGQQLAHHRNPSCIQNVVSSNWSALTNKVLLNLTLIVEQRHTLEEEEKRVCLELNIHEVEQLLNKLKEIKRALKL